MLVDNDDYAISVTITSIDNEEQSVPPSDNFILPYAEAG